ncbi:MAG: hypothetical protein KA151_04920 [Piscinibacter sp.]|nr:hypothetical protein [Piscinibacter sp.]
MMMMSWWDAKSRVAGALRRLFAVGLLAAVAGCAAPTVLNTQWVDPQFTEKPVRAILVVGVTKDAANRRAFEDAMVAQLVARGVKAAPSYRYVPDAGPASQQQMLDALTGSGADAVMLTRVSSVSQSVQVTPGMYMGPPMRYGFGGFYGYYGGMWASSYYVPPSIYVQDNVVADTRLFEAKGFALVWSASTTTTPGSQSTAALFEQFAALITTTLAGDKLI